MDVRCNRCATEYDFDDALISERGTTVKCTNCGYQFKVFPPNPALLAPERWVVRTSAGVEHVFLSLRELQRGITDQKVNADDLLSRGQQPPRPLGSIAELEQFFTNPSTFEGSPRTLHGVAPLRNGSVVRQPVAPPASTASPLTPPAQESPPPGTRRTNPFGTLVSEPVADRRADDASGAAPRAPEPELPPSPLTLPGNSPEYPGESLAVPAASPASATAPPASLSPSPSPASPRPAPAPVPAGGIPRAPSNPQFVRGSQPELGAPLGQIPDLRSSPRASGANSPPPSRRDFRSYDELALDSLPDPRRRVRSRWIAAVVVAGIATLFAFTVGRRFIVETRAPSVEPVPGGDAKFAALLKDGVRLLDAGQLDEAGEQLTRATALADKDPNVLAALARLSVLRADVSWLKLRLLDPKLDELSVQATQRELGRAVGKAQSAVNAAFTVAPENLVVLRARVDALRLSGDRDTAREWLKPIASDPANPANAYVLAALDLAEDSPAYSSVVSRLRTAASGEPKPGRAHIALVYALARSGRLAEAEATLRKFDSDASSAPLIDELTTFLARERSGPRAPDKVKPAATPRAPAAPPPPKSEPPPQAPAGSGASADFRKLLEQASQALGRGEYARAEALYEQVLAQRPGNTEALSGLGDVARRQNDPARAAQLYEQVLAENPNYVPALLASADQKWSSGERSAALALYRRVLEQTGPSSTYGKRAAARIAEASGAGGEPRTEAAEAAPSQDGPKPEADTEYPPPESDAPSAPPRNPDIDTTDLPEFK